MQTERKFQFIERIMIQHAHPAKLAIDITGVLIGWYLLWSHHLLLALGALFGVSILGSVFVWRHDVAQLYETKLGQWMIGQAEPLNLLVRSVGFAVICYGFWSHTALYFPAGIVLIIVARLLGSKARTTQKT